MKPNRKPLAVMEPLPVRTAGTQLEIAAQWLHDAALLLTELKHVDMSMQLTRVAHDCEAVAGRAA